MTGTGTRVDLAHVAIDLPDDWDHTVLDGPMALVARPGAWRGRFTLTITVTRAQIPGVTTLGEYSEVQLAEVANAIGGHLVHVETGYRPHAHLDLTVAAEQVGVDVTVTQRHLVDEAQTTGSGCTAVVVTAAAADRDWAKLASTLLAAVRTVRTVDR